MMNKETVFTKDLPNKRLHIVRSFNAPVDLVWRAWTESEILDQWWAPKPYKAETKSLTFKVGGSWLYSMTGPTGDRSWCREEYQAINIERDITSTAMFCDEEGNRNIDFPYMHWQKDFIANGNETTVDVELTFDKEADLEMIMQMGFKEGFTAGLSNLDQYLTAQFK